MRNTGLALLICVFIAIFCPVLPAADLNQGFLSLPWGTRAGDIQDLTLVGEKGPVSYYQNSNQELTILDKAIPPPIYGFFDNRLFAVYTRVETQIQYDRVYAYLTGKYGPARTTLRVEPHQTTETWKTGDVKIKLKRNQENWSMKLAFYYMPLTAELNEVENEAYAESQRRLFPVEKDRRPLAVPFLKW